MLFGTLALPNDSLSHSLPVISKKICNNSITLLQNYKFIKSYKVGWVWIWRTWVFTSQIPEIHSLVSHNCDTFCPAAMCLLFSNSILSNNSHKYYNANLCIHSYMDIKYYQLFQLNAALYSGNLITGHSQAFSNPGILIRAFFLFTIVFVIMFANAVLQL